MTNFSELPLGQAFLYWVPSIVVVLGMFVVLCASFWRFHRKKMMKRMLHYEYIEANLDVKRPRIGAIHCFSHSARVTDLTLSLSSRDLPWGRSPRQMYGRQFSRSVSNPGFDLYGNPLGVLKEESDVHNSQIHRRDTVPSFDPPPHYSIPEEYDSPVTPSAINSYYDDCGLPVPTSKPRKKQEPDLGKRRKSGFDSMFRGTTPSEGSNPPTELCNRIEPVTHSPRRLPDIETSYWKTVDPKTVVAMGNHLSPLSLSPDVPRSLSNEYEYDLNFKRSRYKKKRKRSFKSISEKIIKDKREEKERSSTKDPKKKKKAQKKTNNSEALGISPYHVNLDDPIQKRIFWLSPNDVCQTAL